MPIFSGSGRNGNVKEKMWWEEVEDEAYISLPNSTTGLCLAMCDDQFVIFFWSSAGTVIILIGSDDTADTDTDGKFCLLDGGTHVNLKNRLGSTQDIMYLCLYE